jgi:uncharacterized RDD family membrane protein YckC
LSTGTNPPQLAFETLSAAPYRPPPRRVGALWRRFLAFLIDSLVVGFAGLVLGYFFFDLLMELGPAGRLVGYFVGFFYFAIPESSFGNGQSLGKRLMLLQIVDADGTPLSIERSTIRYTIFAIPWFVNLLSLPISRTPSAWNVLSSLAVFGLGGATLYLMLFNRNTRQGIHDLAVGSYVAETGKDGPVTAHPTMKVHWFVAAGIVVLTAVAGIFAPVFPGRRPSPQLIKDAQQIEKLPGVHSANILQVSGYHAGAKDVSLLAEVRCTIATSDQEALANQVADSLITTDPAIDQYSTLRIVLIRGYDIGIAHSSFTEIFTDSPAHWRQQLFTVTPQLPAH